MEFSVEGGNGYLELPTGLAGSRGCRSTLSMGGLVTICWRRHLLRWFVRQHFDEMVRKTVWRSSEDAGMLRLVPEATHYYPAYPVSCSVYQHLQVHGYTADSGLAVPRQLQIQVHVATMHALHYRLRPTRRFYLDAGWVTRIFIPNPNIEQDFTMCLSEENPFSARDAVHQCRRASMRRRNVGHGVCLVRRTIRSKSAGGREAEHCGRIVQLLCRHVVCCIGQYRPLYFLTITAGALRHTRN